MQAVEPNWLVKMVSFDLHRGQITTLGPFANKTPLSALPSTGGAMPYFLSFSFASLVIQSVVQAGE